MFYLYFWLPELGWTLWGSYDSRWAMESWIDALMKRSYDVQYLAW